MQYLIIFIIFIAVFTFINKGNQTMANKGMAAAEAKNPMPELAEKLGLQYKSLKEEGKGKKTIMNSGDQIYGEYKGLPIDITFTMSANHSDSIPLGYAHAYTYSYQRTITIEVANPNDAKFQIMANNKNIVSKPTGNPDFDKNMVMDGDATIPQEFIEYFAGLGWMNLKLKGKKLIFNDDYMEQFSTKEKAMQMMTAVHPIWKTSAKNTQMDLDNAQAFIDQLVKLAKTWN